MGTATEALTVTGNLVVQAASAPSTDAGDVTLDGSLLANSGISTTTTVLALNLKLTSNPASTADLGADFLHALTIPKAGGLLVSDGIGGVSVADGAGIASVALAGGNQGWTVTLSHAMTSTNYWVTATYHVVAGGNSTNTFVPKVHITGVSAFDVLLQKSTDESYPSVAAAVFGVSIQVFGRHT